MTHESACSQKPRLGVSPGAVRSRAPQRRGTLHPTGLRAAAHLCRPQSAEPPAPPATGLFTLNPTEDDGRAPPGTSAGGRQAPAPLLYSIIIINNNNGGRGLLAGAPGLTPLPPRTHRLPAAAAAGLGEAPAGGGSQLRGSRQASPSPSPAPPPASGGCERRQSRHGARAAQSRAPPPGSPRRGEAPASPDVCIAHTRPSSQPRRCRSPSARLAQPPCPPARARQLPGEPRAPLALPPLSRPRHWGETH